MLCPYCNQEIPAGLPICPECGQAMPVPKKKAGNLLPLLLLGIMFAIGLVLFFLLPGCRILFRIYATLYTIYPVDKSLKSLSVTIF